MSVSKPPKPEAALQRIAKLLARAGIASRREIERMILDGRIALDGKVLDTPATVLPSLDGVTVDGQPVQAPAPARLFRYHKPAGLLTAERDFTGRPTIYDRMPPGLPRVMPVGRLDLNTEGLLLLTTDGELKRQLELPSVGVERSYRARAYGQVSQAQLEDLMLGTEIEGVRYGSINANIERRTGANLWIEMTLTEGKNREVRRVLEHLGLQVSRLIRTRYGPFHLGDLPAGDVDEIRQNDLATFRTVLVKPGGGKAASNLQFAVRQRVVEPAPAPSTGREPERPSNRPARGPAPRPRPVGAEPAPFAPRAAPGRAAERPAREGDRARPARAAAPRRGRDELPNVPSRFAPARPPERPGEETRPMGRSGRPGRTSAPRPARDDQPKFTPRVTPGRAPERTGREDDRTIAKPARAARARAHRETQEPRAGEIVDRPRGPRKPTAGPSGGRGRPARPDKPKPGRPPRTRK
ncbi:pseudouridine synthase [Sphingomonas sp. JC676]|uniref:pseudouridine synthase n=1 Tax=Sphingomonas sp. JC676 TaxID=2768065 RepID=UPI00292A56E5|nr:pseudouridine synthase [Sphingomonas sp. JC676]